MILVTVGNAFQRFTRLLDGVEAAAGDGLFGDERIVMQTGHNSAFHSGRCETFAFTPLPEFERRLEDASLVISHGGCTVLQVIRRGKLPVVMPRLRRYGEHINDHQLYYAQALAKEGLIIPAYDASELRDAIRAAQRRNGRQDRPAPSAIFGLVRQAMSELLGS